AEVAGEVVAVGKNVREFKKGDRVFGTGPGNISCFAEYVQMSTVPGTIFKIPSALSYEEAASLFMIYPTSYLGLIQRAQLKKGEVCLVHAAAGGVGTAAVQIAKSVGAVVIATAGSDEKCAIAAAQGADYTINYNKVKDWVAKVNDITMGIPGRRKRGADVIYDPVGYFIKDTGCVAWNGRILVVGFAGTGGAIEAVPSNRLLLKGASLVGVFWGGTTLNDRQAARETWAGVFELFSKPKSDGTFWKPVVFAQQYKGLHSIAAALADLESRKTWGKVVVTVSNASTKL
ncbi:hypothetical protein HDU96_001688, partial [Phlyctochytrium bullatum]